MRFRRRRTYRPGHLLLAATLAVALVVSCGGKDTPTEIASSLPRAKDVIPGQGDDLPYLTEAMRRATSDDSTASYAGFDTYAYPGDATMRAWRDEGTYHWVGYYLPSPCHKGRTWVGKRQALQDMGWGLAIVYVGQQTWGSELNPVARRSSGKRSTRAVSDCQASYLSAARGVQDANDAIAVARAEGFPKGTVVFLDVERMEIVPPAMRAYYKAWTERVLAEGTYVPGAYVHTHNAKVIFGDIKGMYMAAGRTDVEPPFWIAGKGEDFSFTLDRNPMQIGHEFATMWQGKIDIVERRAGKKLPIDVNVARTPDPSHPVTAVVD